MGTDNTITNEMWEEFLANGKGALAGSFLPVPDTEETSALATIQNGLSDSHIKAQGVSSVSIKNAGVGAAQLAALKHLVFTGKNGSGAITLTGTILGATVLNIVNLTTPANAEASFETTITVSGQIQQSSASDLSAVKFLAIMLSPGA